MSTTTHIDVQPVESSQIYGVGYDPLTKRLAIRFKSKTGEPTLLYYYENVTPSDHAALILAESIGSHFYKTIKPFPEKFPYQRIQEN